MLLRRGLLGQHQVGAQGRLPRHRHRRRCLVHTYGRFLSVLEMPRTATTLFTRPCSRARHQSVSNIEHVRVWFACLWLVLSLPLARASRQNSALSTCGLTIAVPSLVEPLCASIGAKTHSRARAPLAPPQSTTNIARLSLSGTPLTRHTACTYPEHAPAGQAVRCSAAGVTFAVDRDNFVCDSGYIFVPSNDYGDQCKGMGLCVCVCVCVHV